MTNALFTETSDPAAVFNVPKLAKPPSRLRSPNEPIKIVPSFALAPVEFVLSGAPRRVNAAVEAMLRVAPALVMERLLIVVFPASIAAEVEEVIKQSLLELGAVGGAQLNGSLKRLFLSNPVHSKSVTATSSVLRTPLRAALQKR